MLYTYLLVVFSPLLLGVPVVHCISQDSLGASVLLAEPLWGVQYIPTSPANHANPLGFSYLVLLGYVQDILEECDLLSSCDTI